SARRNHRRIARNLCLLTRPARSGRADLLRVGVSAPHPCVPPNATRPGDFLHRDTVPFVTIVSVQGHIPLTPGIPRQYRMADRTPQMGCDLALTEHGPAVVDAEQAVGCHCRRTLALKG